MSDIAHEKHSPLDQFKIEKIFDLKIGAWDISLTNSSLYMILATLSAILFMFLATRKKSLIPGRLQTVAESVYNFVADMVKTSIGNEGNKFFPLVFSLFIFILFCNILGMTPYSFTVTSHIAVTFSLAMIAFLAITIFAIARNGFGGFLHMFLPSGVPIFMAPFIFAIEFFSFLIRPLTLSVRLFANIVAGHVLLKVIAGFIIALGVIFGTMPMLFAVIMTGFELFVAVLQSYIFAILVCAYLGDVTKQH
ncbi:MAG: atpB [Rickettsiaceae bacterium]|jgi:F-type H+-transporting ATPase subunit a|nr:atpB [Rickettsiaceae bacterium]